MVLRSAKPPTPIFIIPYSTVPLVTTASHPPSRKSIHDIHIQYPLRPLTSSQRPRGNPDADGPTQACAVWNRKFKVVAGSTRPPPYPEDLRA